MDPQRQPEAPDAAAGPGADELGPELYGELRRVAERAMARERHGHTLQPTALVHEAYLRLLGQRVAWRSRTHFLGVAGQAMRRILVDHARRRAAAKRPSPAGRVTLSGLAAAESNEEVDLLDLDAALDRLARLDPRAARVVELRGFAGCTSEEAAEALGVSAATVARDWRMARSWLRRELARGTAAGEPAAPEAPDMPDTPRERPV